MDEKDKDDKEKAQEDAMLTTRNDPEESKDPDVEPDAPEMPDAPQPISGEVLQAETDGLPEDDQSEPKEMKVGNDDMDYLMGQIEARDEMIVNLQGRVKGLEKKKKAGDTSNLAGAIKAMAGLTMSPDGLSAFKQMVPYLFEE